MQLFGTDGIRGRANVDLTPELTTRVAKAAAKVLGAADHLEQVAIVGRDPRPSGEMIEAALVAGLAASGVHVKCIGVAPTPAVAFLTDQQDASLGVMISASHNPMPDNGIKFFARKGRKLADDTEREIERAFESGDLEKTRGVGRVSDNPELIETYLEHLLASVDTALNGLKVVVDCANGAAAPIAGEVYRRAGAEVILTHIDLTGEHINENCGSTHLDSLISRVLAEKADLGIAHDGDADRCLAVDAQGQLVDGDQILAILASGMKAESKLPQNTLVTTVMANLGLHAAMRELEINLVQTPVGDRYVLESMEDGGYALGGEQSGHIVLAEYATTGDGLLTALHLMSRMAKTKKSLAELASVVRRHPQVLINVPGVDKSRVDTHPAVVEAVARARKQLGEHGRVLLRASGTEPVIRVMVEADSEARAEEVATEIASIVTDSLKLG